MKMAKLRVCVWSKETPAWQLPPFKPSSSGDIAPLLAMEKPSLSRPS
jgi:hypothetical protein